MSNHPELWSAGDTLRPDIAARTAEQDAARLAVLRRYERGRDTADQTLTILQALGIEPTPPAEPQCPPLSTRQRQQAARRAERATTTKKDDAP